MRKRPRTDRDHAAIVRDLRTCGFRVLSLASLGAGAPDLLIYRADRGLELLEVKSPTGKLTPDQVAFQAEGWPVRVITSADLVSYLASVRSRD